MKIAKLFISIFLLLISITSHNQIKVYSSGNVGMGLDPGAAYRFALKQGSYQSLFGSNTEGTGGCVRLFSNIGGFFYIGSWNFSNGGLISRIGINYSIHGGTGTYDYALDGSRKAPMMQFNAEDGSITLYGEIGSGSNYRTPVYKLGIKVGSSGNIGIKREPTSYALDVFGIVNAFNVSPSDERLKSNISNVTNNLSSLLKLRGVKYNMNRPESINPNTTLSKMSAGIDSGVVRSTSNQTIDTVFFNRKHIGFLAQELQKVYPELVYQGSDGLYSIDYIGLIPVIVESMKELNTQIAENTKLSTELDKTNTKLAELEKRLNICCIATNQKGSTSESVQSVSIAINTLYPNIPNPFSDKTEIKYTIVDDLIKAMLNVYDLQGFQIKSYPIVLKGSGSVTINGSELKPGIYMYSLIVNGHEIDTKRMILTQ